MSRQSDPAQSIGLMAFAGRRVRGLSLKAIHNPRHKGAFRECFAFQFVLAPKMHGRSTTRKRVTATAAGQACSSKSG
jgi:hypothetical protein